MDKEELGAKLRELCNQTGGDKGTIVQLFGIMFADEIKWAKADPKDIIAAAGVSSIDPTYATGIHNGIRLADYVVLKK